MLCFVRQRPRTCPVKGTRVGILTGRVLRDIRTRVPVLTWAVPVEGSAVGTVGGHQSMAKERVVGAESGVDSPLSACAFSSVASYDISHASHTK